MLRITYIFHSGFVIESDSAILLFDFWMDPSGVVDKVFSTCRKPIYVFSSHFHEDHFTRHIFEWRRLYPSLSYTYILSRDILKRRRASQQDADVWMGKGATWHDNILSVVATGSNDSGVSWVVDVDGHRIFHAGDLCNWYARFLSDDNGGNKDVFGEMGLVNPVAEEKRFLGELKDILKVANAFDIVMFPVDGRIGNGYTLGARQFIERFGVRLFVPMHFVASGFESAWRMEPFCAEKGIPFWSIARDGDEFSFVSTTCHASSLQ